LLANTVRDYVVSYSINISAVSKMLDMSIGDVIKLVDTSGVDEKMMIQLVEDMREAFQLWVSNLVYIMRIE